MYYLAANIINLKGIILQACPRGVSIENRLRYRRKYVINYYDYVKKQIDWDSLIILKKN